MNVHSNCQKKVANLCGINQKLLAEALSQVSQVRTVPCCVRLNELQQAGEILLFDSNHFPFVFSRVHVFFFLNFLLRLFFFFFRNQSRSLKNQTPQTLESTRMCVVQQRTLVVRFMHRRTTIPPPPKKILPFILASIISICGLWSKLCFVLLEWNFKDSRQTTFWCFCIFLRLHAFLHKLSQVFLSVSVSWLCSDRRWHGTQQCGPRPKRQTHPSPVAPHPEPPHLP